MPLYMQTFYSLRLEGSGANAPSPGQIIILCITWYTSFTLSLRKVGDHDDGSWGSVASFGTKQDSAEKTSFSGNSGRHFEQFVDEPILSPNNAASGSGRRAQSGQVPAGRGPVAPGGVLAGSGTFWRLRPLTEGIIASYLQSQSCDGLVKRTT
jgi:hypothetical protein